MKPHALTVGMCIRHPHHGEGIVEKVTPNSAEIRFGHILRTIDPELAEITAPEPRVPVAGQEIPLHEFIEQTIEAVLKRLGVERPEATVAELGTRWQKGKMVLHPSDPTLQTKEIPMDVFFHKVVGLRNQLRVLEQKINSHPALSDGDKVEMQQYISRCYGSLTTFNLLFKNREDQFSSKGE